MQVWVDGNGGVKRVVGVNRFMTRSPSAPCLTPATNTGRMFGQNDYQYIGVPENTLLYNLYHKSLLEHTLYFVFTIIESSNKHGTLC